MRKMKAEKLIEIMKKFGTSVHITNNEVVVQGGNIHKLPDEHPRWRLLLLHYKELCKHFGVPE